MLVQARCVINPDERVLPDELAHVFTGVRGIGFLRTSPQRSSTKFVRSMVVIFGSEELRATLPNMYAVYTQNPAAG
jgi:hypothetical protein